MGDLLVPSKQRIRGIERLELETRDGSSGESVWGLDPPLAPSGWGGRARVPHKSGTPPSTRRHPMSPRDPNGVRILLEEAQQS